MKITFIYPRFEKFLESVEKMNGASDFFTVGKFVCPPALGIPILASLTPDDVDVNFVDDNAGERVDFDDGSDLYAISCFTPQGTRALELAREGRAKGRRIAMGGMFPSFMADDCLEVADCVCIGEGENIWAELVEDLRRGALKRVYRSRRPVDMSVQPMPRRDLFYGKKSYDWDEDLIQLTRGCLYDCAMCILPNHMGSRMRFKPVEKAVEELRSLKFENVYLTDDSLFFPQRPVREYAERFFDAAAETGKKFFVSSTLALNCDEAFLRRAARAGVRNFYCTLNVDPLSVRLLKGDAAAREKFARLADILRGLDINLFASFGIGRDWDDDSISSRVLKLCDFAKITTAEFFLFSPYPGSPHWDRLLSQNRIVSREWYKYNGANVVFKPAKMTAEKLYNEFVNCWRGFYEMNSSRNLAHMEPSVWKNGEMTITKSLEKRGVESEAAITGVGVLSPIGNSPAEVLKSLREKRDGIAEATKIDTSKFLSHLCGEVKNFDFASTMSAVELAEYTDPFFRLAICAARKALADSAIDLSGKKVGMVIATCNAGLNSGEAEYVKKYENPETVFDRSVSQQSEFYSIGKAMSRALKIGGECWIVNTACSGSTAALGFAETLVESGRCDVVVAGGADAVSLSNYAGFSAIKVVSPEKIAPFSTPTGMNIGEGAAFWIVENLADALLRKAKCYGKIIGHATTGDAHHPTQPDPRGDGAYRTMRNAAANAGVKVSQIGCINAHGSGTAANDKAESKGVAKFLNGANIPITSTKSYTGHCMGATGIIEATCQLLAMNDDFIPPTLRNVGLRAGCEISAVGGDGIEGSYDCFLSANYAFAGNNAAIVVAKRDFTEYKKPQKNSSARAVITGCGLVSSVGIGNDANLDALGRGDVGIRKITRFDSERYAGTVEISNPRALDRRIDFGGMNPISTFAALAAKLALDDAQIRIRRDNCERVGLAVSVCRGSSETAHMEAVFDNPDRRGDIGCFSNVTANSTAGWVSKALEIKGANITLTSGPNSGFQTVAYCAQLVRDGEADAIVAIGADEIYKQQLDGYEKIGSIFTDSKERDFHLDYSSYYKSVLGEGAAALAVESAESAQKRGARVLGEILGDASTFDQREFLDPDLDGDGLSRAVNLALERAGLKAADIDLIVWSPRGCAQDSRAIFLRDSMFPSVPMVATSLHTGYAETASTLHALGCVLESLARGAPLWRQITGVAPLDALPLPTDPKRILCMASSFMGNSHALVVGR